MSKKGGGRGLEGETRSVYSHSIWYRVVTGKMVEGKREKGGWWEGVKLLGRGSGQRWDAQRLRGAQSCVRHLSRRDNYSHPLVPPFDSVQ